MSVGRNLQEMENVVTKGAAPAEPMHHLDGATPGQTGGWEDLGGPTPENYRSDDSSAELKTPGKTLQAVRNVVNKGAKAADPMKGLKKSQAVKEEEELEDQDLVQEETDEEEELDIEEVEETEDEEVVAEATEEDNVVEVQQEDNRFHVFVGELNGDFLPFDPAPNSPAAGDSEYANEQLNNIGKLVRDDGSTKKIDQKKLDAMIDKYYSKIGDESKEVMKRDYDERNKTIKYILLNDEEAEKRSKLKKINNVSDRKMYVAMLNALHAPVAPDDLSNQKANIELEEE